MAEEDNFLKLQMNREPCRLDPFKGLDQERILTLGSKVNSLLTMFGVLTDSVSAKLEVMNRHLDRLQKRVDENEISIRSIKRVNAMSADERYSKQLKDSYLRKPI